MIVDNAESDNKWRRSDFAFLNSASEILCLSYKKDKHAHI